jgi:ABC-type spermidine/putrescine transport system permease subunit I
VYPRWLWPSFALPGVVWLLVLFVVPFYAIISVAFGSVDAVFFQIPVPYWNPMDWNTAWMSQVLSDFAPGEKYWTVGLRTIEYVVCAIILSLGIGYPVAYYISRHAGRTKALLLILLILPFWISYLMRMLAWINLLAEDGYATRFLSFFQIDTLFVKLGLLDQSAGWLDGQPVSVVLALVYGYIPFFILPLFAALDRIDRAHIEAARDLGASPFRAFLHVTLPLSKAGILAGTVLIALPMFGDYYTPDLISASPNTNMIGNQIDLYIRQGPQKTIGAALTLVLAAFLTLLMAYYLFSTHRASREARAS